jgi:kynurenine formamidase
MNNDIEIIDLSHSLSTNMPTWDGSCGFASSIRHDYDKSSSKVSFRVQGLSMHAGIGTHMDAPAHCFPQGKTIDNIPLNSLFAACAVIDVSSVLSDHLKVDIDHLQRWEKDYGLIPEKSIVIIYTGWDRFFNDAQRYRNNYKFPFLDKTAALYLAERNILGFGIDTLSPDRPDNGYPVHEVLLGAGIYIIENVANASALPRLGADILALPLKIQDGTEAPLRLVGLIKKPARKSGFKIQKL